MKLSFFSICKIFIFRRCLTFLFLGGIIFTAVADESSKTPTPDAEKRILMIYSYSNNFAPDFQISNTICEQLGKKLQTPLRFQYMELNAFQKEDAQDSALLKKLAPFREDLIRKKFDLILAMGSTAIELLERHAEFFPPEIPIVFFGLHSETRDFCKKHPNSTGTIGQVSFADNVDLAIYLFPETKKILLLTDSSPHGKKLQNTARKSMIHYPNFRLEILDNSQYSLSGLLHQLENCPPNTLIFFYSWFNQDTSNLNTLQYLFSRLEFSRTPIFALQEPMLQTNAVAGVFPSTTVIGQSLAEQMEKILSGTPPHNIPIVIPTRKAVINYHAIESGILSGKHLPPTAEIIGESEVNGYKKNILLLGISGTASLLLAALFWLGGAFQRKQNLLQRLQKDFDLQKETGSPRIYEAIFDISPIGLIIKDADHDFRFVKCNQAFINIVKRPSEEIIGKNDFELNFPIYNTNDSVEEDRKLLQDGGICEKIEQSTQPNMEPQSFRILKMPFTTPDQRHFILGLFLDISVNAKREKNQEILLEEKNNFLANEEIVNRCLRNLTIEPNFDKAIGNMLELIGKSTGADRCYVFRFCENYHYCTNLYEWVSKPHFAEINNLQKEDMQKYPGWLTCLQAHQDVVIDDTNALPGEFCNGNIGLRQQNIKSLYACGIWLNGCLAGFLGIDFVRTKHKFTESDRKMLSDTSQIYSLGLLRKQQLQKITEQNFRESQIYSHLHIPMFLFDKDGRMLRANPSACKLAEMDEQKLITCNCNDIICKRATRDFGCPVLQAAKTGKSVRETRAVDGHD